MIGKTVSHYRILEKLGEGGMGVVYKAEDTKLRRTVALKFLPPTLLATDEDRRRFAHEAQASASLSHPNIATVFEIDENGPEPFIALEYIEGQSLADKVKSGPLKLEEAVSIAGQLSEGLQAAHEKGIVHRDVKSQNIMVTTKGQVKILDFGLAKLRGASVVTRAGTTLGTMGYMSPEQLRGEPVDHRSDLWALGVVFYEMIAGRKPFHGDYEEAVAYQVLNGQPEPLTAIRTGVPMEMERMVNKLLQKNPQARYQHLDELRVDLRSLQQNSETNGPNRQWKSAARISKKPVILYGAVAVLFLVLVGGGLYLLRFAGKEKSRHSSQAETTSPGNNVGRKNSVAVLPFKNISSEKEQEYFCDGMTEQIITNLSRLQGMNVIARTSVMQFKNSEKPVPEIGTLLGVANVLEGSIRKSGNRIRVTAQLIKADDGFQLWAQDYDRELKDVFAVQDDVSNAIVKAMKVTLSGDQSAAISKRYTENTEAYQHYLKGRFHWNKRTEAEEQLAISLFEKAIEIDPSFALAYSGLADAYAVLGTFGFLPPGDTWPKAKTAALKALDLDDQIGEAHSSLGYVKWVYDLDWRGAEEEFHRAIELNPSDALAHSRYANYLLTFSRFDEAIAEDRRAMQLDPLSASIAQGLVGTYVHARQYDRAIEAVRNVIELDSTNGMMQLQLGVAFLGKGIYSEGIAHLQDAAARHVNAGGTSALALLGYAYGLAGQKQQAQEILQQIIQGAEEHYIKPTSCALVCVGLGQYEQAIMWLQKAYVEERSVYLTHLKVESPWDPLRSNPKFIDLLKKMGLEK
jgi:serine/threonine protein kinase/tetratricopeptide (TPR) repeat protein